MTLADDAEWMERVRALADERDALILAHNYQSADIQDVAHHVGDSLALSRIAAKADESTIKWPTGFLSLDDMLLLFFGVYSFKMYNSLYEF